jgi:hypothetical protein
VIALATAWSWNNRKTKNMNRLEMFSFVLDRLPDSDVKSAIKTASELPLDYSVITAAALYVGYESIPED